MHVTRDVILDLAPLYLTGEASADTHALVENYLSSDAELARWMATQRDELFASMDDAIPPDLEARTLTRTRRVLFVQRWLFGLGCFFVALSLSTEFTTRNGRLVELHLLARDYPMAAAICVLVATLFFTLYRVARRRSL